MAASLGIAYRAPEDKIAIVKEYQRQGRVVVTIGNGVNDAPADVGIAMGAASSPIAIEAAEIALMREDWSSSRRSCGSQDGPWDHGAIRFNLGFTVVYNLTGLSLAAFGFRSPAIAAAAQSLPDFGILANSARLLRQKRSTRSTSGASDGVDASLVPGITIR